MIKKVALIRRWTGKVPLGRDGVPIPKSLWPRRRNCVWLVRWFAPNHVGKVVRRSKRFKTREEAELFQAARQAEFDAVPDTRRIARKVTVGDYTDEFLDLKTGPRGTRLRGTSLALFRGALNRFSNFVGKDRLLAAITKADAVRFVASLRDDPKQLAPATINKTRRALRSAFAVAVNQLELIPHNPFRGLRDDPVADSPIRYVSAEEFDAMITSCRMLSAENSLWWRAFLTTAYTCGLRYGEILHLTWGDVDFQEDMVRVTAKAATKTTLPWTPETHDMRVVPAPAATMALLSELQATCPDGHAYVFLPDDRFRDVQAAQAAGTWNECRAVLGNFQRDLRRIIRRAAKTCPSLLDQDGKTTVSIHDFRRSAVTNWSRVANIQTTMALAGHSNMQTTKRYYAATTPDQIELARQASTRAVERHGNSAQ